MAVYNISYANLNGESRIRFGYDAVGPLTHFDVVCLAARHRMRDEVLIIAEATSLSGEAAVSRNVRIMNGAGIQLVEFIIEGTNYIQCVPSLWIGPTFGDIKPFDLFDNKTRP